MRILAIYRHYWPDTTPYARLLRGILEDLVEHGHQAAVFSAQPGYNDSKHDRQGAREMLGGVDVRRIDLLPERKRWKVVRSINFAWFLLRSIAFAWRHRREFDLVVANVHPPVLMGVALRWIRRLTGLPYMLHVQDIHPESAILAGQLRPGRVSQWLQDADAKSINQAASVVTLSTDMRDALLKRRRSELPAERVAIINNFPLDTYRAANEVELPNLFRTANVAEVGTPFRVLFAGNLGHFQQLDRVVAAARQLADNRQIQFIFMGAGAAKASLEEAAGEMVGRTVHFVPHQSVEVACACMKRSDLGIISLTPGVYQLAYPSKTMTYLAAGLPVLALVESDCSIAREVIDHQLGYVPCGATPAEVSQAILTAYQQRDRWNAAARAALIERAERRFGRGQALLAWRQLMQSLEGSAASPQPETVSHKQAA